MSSRPARASYWDTISKLINKWSSQRLLVYLLACCVLTICVCNLIPILITLCKTYYCFSNFAKEEAKVLGGWVTCPKSDWVLYPGPPIPRVQILSRFVPVPLQTHGPLPCLFHLTLPVSLSSPPPEPPAPTQGLSGPHSSFQSFLCSLAFASTSVFTIRQFLVGSLYGSLLQQASCT